MMKSQGSLLCLLALAVQVCGAVITRPLQRDGFFEDMQKPGLDSRLKALGQNSTLAVNLVASATSNNVQKTSSQVLPLASSVVDSDVPQGTFLNGFETSQSHNPVQGHNGKPSGKDEPQSKPSPLVLQPVPAPHANKSSLANLHPRKDFEMSFAAPPSVDNGPKSVLMTVAKANYPSVQLDNCDFVSDLTCDGRSGTVHFVSEAAFERAFKEWTAIGGPIVLISTSPSCAMNLETGGQGYVLATNVKRDAAKNSIALDLKHITFIEYVGEDTEISVAVDDWSIGKLNGLDPRKPFRGNGEFDRELDEKVGYASSSDDQFFSSFTGTASRAIPPQMARMVSRRSFWGWIKDKLNDAARAIDDAVDKVKKSVEQLLNKDFSQEVSLSYYAGDEIAAFGAKGLELYSYNGAKLYCVGCGSTISAKLYGSFVFTFANGLKAGNLGLKEGNIQVQSSLGIAVDGSLEKSITKDLFSVPLTPFAIPGIFNLGPEITLSAGAGVKLTSQAGAIRVGAILDWRNAEILYDMVDKSKSYTKELAPAFTPIYSVESPSIALEANVHVAFSVAFGLNLFNGAFKLEASLVDRPNIFVSSEYNSGSGVNATCPGGVMLNIGARNEVYADLFGKTRYDISSNEARMVKSCVQLHRPLAKRHAVDAPVIQSIDGSWALRPANDSNVYISAYNATHGSEFVLGDTSSVILDTNDRVLHAYKDELDQLGVSRLRVSDTGHLPLTSRMVALRSSETDDGKTHLVAVDASTTVFLLVGCVFERLSPRVIIAKGLQELDSFLSLAGAAAELLGDTPKECSYIGDYFTMG